MPARSTAVQAAELWPQVVLLAKQYQLQIVALCVTNGGSGSTGSPGGAWLDEWDAHCANLYGAYGCEIDFGCTHAYYFPEVPFGSAALHGFDLGEFFGAQS